MQQQNEEKSSKLVYWISAVLVLVIALILFFVMTQKDDSLNQSAVEKALVIPIVKGKGAQDSIADPEAEDYSFSAQLPLYGEEEGEWQFNRAEPLPELSASDAIYTQDVLKLSEQLQPNVFKKEAIRKTIFSINDMAQGLRPPVKRLREVALTQPFLVTQKGEKMYISAASYQRYDGLAQAINAINPQTAVNFYQRYLPLFQAVFAELSYPSDYKVLDSIKAATAKVIQAPVIAGDIEVIRPAVRYKFADPKLEKLSALDKQMIRMGPENTRVIQDKLRELIEVLIAAEQE